MLSVEEECIFSLLNIFLGRCSNA